MKIIWSDFASTSLSEIYKFHKVAAGLKIAKKIKVKVFEATNQLVDFPQSGQIEKTLEQIDEGHRYLVSGNYKIVYKLVDEGILITDIFDTRQDPTKINNPKRNMGNN